MKSIGGMTIGIICTCAASLAWARTATVEVSQDEETGAFTAKFANHASETNGLWVVYGATDRGEGTAGWDHAEFLQTVYPETSSVTYPAPDGWGETVKAIRFVLSEVPYDYDYTLDFLRSGDTSTTGYGNKRIVLNDFAFNTKYRVALTMREVKHNGTSNNLALFSTRDTQGSGTPYFTLFWIGGTTWRFDYNTVNKNSSAGAEPGKIYSIVADGKNGLFVDGTKRGTATLTYLDQVVTGHLEFFCANQTAGTMSNSNGNMDLFGAQVYDSAAADAKLLVNLVPMVKEGRAGMYDTIRDKYYYNDTTAGDFKLTVGPARVENENPYFASALVKVQEAGPTIFAPASYMEKGMGTDPWLRRPVDPLKTMHKMDVLCRHLAARDGLVRESFRLGATDQVVPLHGDCPRFEVFNFCANGQAADGKGGVVDLFEGHFDETPQTSGFENPLSTGYVFTYGDFKFGTFGDLNHVRVTPEWTVNVERIAARHVPKVSLAKFNHHANRRSHPVSWLRALSAKAWVSCNWLEQQADAEIFLKLAETGLLGKGNVYPTVFPLARMEKARTERAAWLDAVAPATCNGAHIVVTVPPDGKTFTVACVDAGDEKMRVLSETKYET